MSADTQPIPQFSDLIARIDAGQVDAVLSAELAALVEAVQHHDKPGTLTIKVGVEPVGAGGRNVAVSVDATTKPPRPRPGESVLWVGEHGSLHRTDPYQQSIDFTTGEITS